MANSGQARVVARTGEGLRTEVSSGGHTMIADEPTSLGGTDVGPTPPTTTCSRPSAAAPR